MKLSSGLAALLVTPALLAGLAAVPTAPATAAAHLADRAGPYDVSLEVDDTQPTVGDRIILRGRVGPAAHGSDVVLQVLYDNRRSWRALDTATVGPTGRYRFHERIKTDRTRKYRVVKAADARHPRAVSHRVRVVAYDWVSLTSLPAVNSTGWVFGPTATVNAKSYPVSLVSSSATTQGTVDVNLSRACTRVDAVYGLDDSSPSAGTATIGLAVDGRPTYAQAFGLSQALHVVTDVTGAFRATLTYALTDGGQAVVGSPKALCHD